MRGIGGETMKSEYVNFLYQLKFSLNSTDATRQLEALDSVRLQYNKISKKSHTDIIRNLPDLLKELRQIPASAFLEGLELAQPLLTSNYQLNPSINNLLNHRDEYEAHQELMGDIVKTIRQHHHFSDKEKEMIYYDIRNLICTNYLINQELLEDKVHDEFIDMVYRLYTEVDLQDEVLTLCPHCTRPIVKGGGCTEVCNFYQRKFPRPLIRKRINLKERYFALSDGVYRFTNLPSIGERYIFKKLQNQFQLGEELVIKLYPNVDRMDIRLSDEKSDLELDIKDYRDPMGLVNFFEREGYQAYKMGEETSNCKRYLVIPDHRVFIYNKDRTKDYMQELRNGFEASNLNLKVIQERELQHLIVKYFGLEI